MHVYSCFPAGDEEDDVPTSAAVGLRLLRVEKTLLNHLAAVLRTVICPKNLVISIAAEEQEGPGAGRRTATPSAPAAAKAEEDVQVSFVWPWMNQAWRLKQEIDEGCSCRNIVLNRSMVVHYNIACGLSLSWVAAMKRKSRSPGCLCCHSLI